MSSMLWSLGKWVVEKTRGASAEGTNLWDRFRTARTALALEDELSLAYLIGHQIDKDPALKLKKKYIGLPLRLLVLLRFVALHTRPFSRRARPCTFFFHAITHNQYESLKSAVQALTRDVVEFTVDPMIHWKSREKEALSCTLFFECSDLLLGSLLFWQRAPGLYLHLLKTNKQDVIDNHFNVLCLSYFYLPAYLRVLQETGCRFVVQSNDHTVGNRSLRLAAEVLHRKTVYLQHASVSQLFPALMFDYVFLDGQASLDIYNLTHEPRRAAHFRPLDGKMTIILSGQKKALARRPNPTAQPVIGMAVNPLDDLPQMLAFLERIVALGIPIRVRTHPAQTAAYLAALQDFSKLHPGVATVRATDQPLIEFLQSLSLLIAGNTSIHLEAVLVGIPAYYILFSSDTDNFDYYGYLRHGLIQPFPTEDLVSNRVELGTLFDRAPDPAVVQYYSATYCTIWEGQEGTLVADCLKKLATGGTRALSLRLLSEDDRFRVFAPAAAPGPLREEA